MTANPDDIAALRADGDLVSYLLSLTGRTPAKPKQAEVEPSEDPGYRIAHPGAWPLGTAASGPTPPPDRCSCPKCSGHTNTRTQRQEGDAA